LKISSSINWTAITGEAANTQRNALGASAIIFSLLVKMAMIGSVIEYNDKTNVANSAAYLIETFFLLSHNFQLHNYNQQLE
jgi:hypothetical protein